jgi:hypothetical protein
MSISSIASASSILNFQDLAAPAAPKASVTTLVSQLEKSISSGNLNTTQTILQSIKALPPSGAGTSDALSAFLKSVGTAVKDNSTSEAEAALTTYQAATAPPPPPASTDAEKSAVGKQLLDDKLTLTLVKMTIEPQNGATATSNSSTGATGSSTDSTGTTGSSALSTSSLTTGGYTTGSLFSAAA